MKSPIQPGYKIGLLGGGQLARMLALAGHPLGFEIHVYSENKMDPAALVTAHHHQHSMTDVTSLRSFIKSMDVVTFESEFLDVDILKQAEKPAKKIWPRPDVMGLLQDRKPQKELLDRFQIPTSPWIPVSSKKELERVLQQIESPLIFKKRRFGYDGYGTYPIKDFNSAKKMLESFSKEKVFPPLIVEKWIPFQRELACIFVRNRSGEIVHYPLVESFQKDSRCFWVKGPVQHKKFPQLTKKIKKMMAEIEYVGTLGVEMFDTGAELLINELAPRVHNSGHYTTNAFPVDQFSMHLRAITNQSLRPPKSAFKGFAMVNLLGPLSADSQPPKSAHLHWYGKSEARPGRKMGHLNTTSNDKNAAHKALKKALKAQKRMQHES